MSVYELSWLLPSIVADFEESVTGVIAMSVYELSWPLPSYSCRLE